MYLDDVQSKGSLVWIKATYYFILFVGSLSVCPQVARPPATNVCFVGMFKNA